MTRATLLHLLADPTALTGADVRALEALAAAFPYCQTAHLLLAKAAHDQDSMLAGQRLRRAATYAADRTLLRQLIEQQPVAAEAEATAAASVPAALQSNATDLATFAAAPATLAVAEPSAGLPPAPPTLADYPTPELLAAPIAPTEPTEALIAGVPAEPEAPAAPAVAAPAPPTAAEPTRPEATPANQTTATEAAPEPANAPPATPAEAVPESAAPDSTLELQAVEAILDEPVTAEATPAQQPEPPAGAVASGDPELPPQAPPIRPPEQAEAARHEFGLAPPEVAEVAPYRLPELELAITVPLPPGPATPRLPAFSGVPDVAYAPGEGSRLGFCLVPAAETAEATPDQVPPTRLPPAGEFFAPDALLTEYVATPPAPAPHPLDLIDSFLQRSPAATRRRPQSSAVGQQADLSARSTRAVPELASESLALILVRQGKIEQAIVIYERLMVKNPEKIAYFAAQIDQLRPSA